MTIGDIAPKINSQQAETHCLNSNDIPNSNVLYNNTNIGTIKNNTIATKTNFFNLLITCLPQKQLTL